jgi:WD40 repeat protein
MALAALAAVSAATLAQQPAGKKDPKKDSEKGELKGPLFPPINPALAKLEVTVPGLDGPGFAIAYGAEADLLVVGCENGTLRAFTKDALAAYKSGTGKPDMWKGHRGPVRAVAWNGGPVLASIGADKKINFWKMPQGQLVHSSNADFRIRAAAMASDGTILATAGESDVIQFWDVATGKPGPKLTDNMDWTLCVAFSADSKKLLSGDNLGVVRLWDVAGASKMMELPAKPIPAPKTPPDPVAATCVAFAPDGKSVVLGTAYGLIHFINLADGKIIRSLVGHTSGVTGIAFHPSGTLMATCSKDRTVKLWNPAAPAPLKSLDGHNAWVEGVTFIEQGTKLATISADQTVRIWDLTEPPKKK